MLELDLAMAISYRDGAKAAAIADAAAERARAAGDETGELLARVGAAYHRMFFATDPDVDELERLARTALPLLEQAEDHAGLVHVWLALGYGVANSAAASRTMRRHRSRHSATPASPDSATRVSSASRPRSPSGRGRRTRRCAPSTRSYPRTHIPGCC